MRSVATWSKIVTVSVSFWLIIVAGMRVTFSDCVTSTVSVAFAKIGGCATAKILVPFPPL